MSALQKKYCSVHLQGATFFELLARPAGTGIIRLDFSFNDFCVRGNFYQLLANFFGLFIPFF